MPAGVVPAGRVTRGDLDEPWNIPLNPPSLDDDFKQASSASWVAAAAVRARVHARRCVHAAGMQRATRCVPQGTPSCMRAVPRSLPVLVLLAALLCRSVLIWCALPLLRSVVPARLSIWHDHEWQTGMLAYTSWFGRVAAICSYYR